MRRFSASAIAAAAKVCFVRVTDLNTLIMLQQRINVWFGKAASQRAGATRAVILGRSCDFAKYAFCAERPLVRSALKVRFPPKLQQSRRTQITKDRKHRSMQQRASVSDFCPFDHPLNSSQARPPDIPMTRPNDLFDSSDCFIRKVVRLTQTLRKTDKVLLGYLREFQRWAAAQKGLREVISAVGGRTHPTHERSNCTRK